MKIIFKLTLLLLAFALTLNANNGFPKEYYKLSVKKQKEFFFDYFGKRIDAENLKILKEREFIKSLKGKKNLDKTSEEYKKLEELQTKYKVKNIYDYEKFLYRVDIIPPSMALAQAATESGWGKSRFFKKANNIFGHWTYNPKIGMVPLQRPAGKKHLVRVFPTLQASIAAYMRNLNKTGAYSEFRIKRKKQRDSGNYINGYLLSETMTKYSGIGHDYVKILQSIIRTNKLKKLDKEFFEKTKKDMKEIKSKEGKK